MSLLAPSIEQLVEEIEAADRLWKQMGELFGEDSTLAISYRALKTCRQTRLLRSYAPAQVVLVMDTEMDIAPEGEALYRLQLRQTIAGRDHAADMPVRVAQEILTVEEIAQFQH